MSLPFIPALRAGRAYESADAVEIRDVRTGIPLARAGTVNAGLIRRDLAKLDQAARALRAMGAAEIMRRMVHAADLFATASLPLGERAQSIDEYVRCLSAASGLPQTLVRKNVDKLTAALRQMPEILAGLLRGIDPAVLDRGWIPWNGSVIAFAPVTTALGVLLPSNSPGVNGLWLPAIPLKTPVVLKPGREEPWTPYRLIQALVAAGLPAEAFSFYPADHAGADEILQGCGRAMLFGDEQTVARHAGNAAIQAHGPGWSKIVIGEDCIDRWPEYLDLCVSSILENGGRSCINASAVVVPRHADAVAEALAARLAAFEALPLDDDRAVLAAFANPVVAERISAMIDEGLRAPGAADLTAAHRGEGRLVRESGAAFLLPTIIRCASFDHPLANREYPFPYASVVEVPQDRIPRAIGRSLVVTVVSSNEGLIRRLFDAPGVEHLHVGPIPTWQVRRDQPHEGNLFEFLYRQRGFQRTG
jgi:acyl-CoA reductase-like NAD-dependent aldehyde dehydrogenase